MRATEIQPKKLVIFDIDDTLVHTQTKVHVIRDGQVIKSLNSHDFTHYKLQPGEEFDFGDFRNAREFFEKSKPIIPMMNQLKRDINTGNTVVMVTARADFDDKELFLDTFRKYGVDMNKVHVYRAGNIKGGTTEQRKKLIIKTLLDKDNYSKAIMYDDAKPNLHTFMELKKDHPRTRFYAWHVSLEGEASEYMREDITLENTKKKAYNLKQIIQDFLPLAARFLKIEQLPKINLVKDVTSKHEQPTFGVYHHNGSKIISIDIEQRHPIDIVRTLAHELVHYKQDLQGRLTDKSWKTGSPTENEAHEKAGELLRLFDKQFPKYLKSPAVKINDELEIEEGWKDWVAGAALGAAALGAQAKPIIVQQGVQPGDTIYSIARQNNVDPKEIMKLNNFDKDTKLKTGTMVKVPDYSRPVEPKKEKNKLNKTNLKIDSGKTVTGTKEEALLRKYAQMANIKGAELVALLSQVAHETLDFRHMAEIGTSNDFKKYDPAHSPSKAKLLGNIKPGDGEKYKGRGFIQLTGRYNYAKAGEALGLPLEQNPELVEKPEVAAKVAIWYWKNRVQPNVSNFKNVRDVTKPINPGLKGLEDRKEKFRTFMVSIK